jgi:hypothetical protein
VQLLGVRLRRARIGQRLGAKAAGQQWAINIRVMVSSAVESLSLDRSLA